VKASRAENVTRASLGVRLNRCCRLAAEDSGRAVRPQL
jgi:hypothetical protein